MQLLLERLNVDTRRWSENALNIFSFEDYRSYLEWVRCNYPGARRPLSLERWSKKLGYKSPRSVAMVLKGQRLPAEEMVLAIASDLKLSQNELRYFQLLIQKEKFSDKPTRMETIHAELQRLNPGLGQRKLLAAEIFSYVSEWYFLPIKQLIRGGSFKEDARWIAKKLRGKVTQKEVEEAIALMLKLGVLTRDSEGHLMISEQQDAITAADIPSAAVRKHFRQQMQRAGEALDEQRLHEREFTSLTLRTSASRLEEAKAMIREFRDQFAGRFEQQESSEIAQLNIQFFFHTEANGD